MLLGLYVTDEDKFVKTAVIYVGNQVEMICAKSCCSIFCSDVFVCN